MAPGYVTIGYDPGIILHLKDSNAKDGVLILNDSFNPIVFDKLNIFKENLCFSYKCYLSWSLRHYNGFDVVL